MAGELSTASSLISHRTPVALLRQLLDSAIASAQPSLCVPRHLPNVPRGRCIVVGAGKASAAMAKAVEDHWTGELSGLVVTRYGHADSCRKIDVVEAGHPLPDAAGLNAARRILERVANLSADDLVLCLLSGGGSALLPLPAAGLTLDMKQSVNRQLLASGASVQEMNCVRRHLSAIKGGRLGVACSPAQVLTLAISDVPGDHCADIASGPTVPDESTCADALRIIQRYSINLPPAAHALLTSGEGETIKPADPRLARSSFRMVASARNALQAAAATARGTGIAVHILSEAIEGESREVGKVIAAIARQVADRNEPFAAPCVLISGGETTVSVRGKGCGGRNVEFLLALCCALDGHPQIYALAADTDGVDGMADIAGAWIGPDTMARAAAAGFRPSDVLERNDAHTLFNALGSSIVTGPTRTNVNDFRAVYIAAPKDG